jgi:hypothetical protein
MRNKWPEAFAIIILINLLLVGFSFVPGISFPLPSGDSLRVKFPATEQLFDFNYTDVNIAADSLIDKYLATDSLVNGRRMLSDIGPKKASEFFTNPENNKTYALDDFFSSLCSPKDSGMLRIAHYGDSQLEGDRITCYLRAYFQKKFGGSGVGYVPFDDIANSSSYVRNSSPNWIRYNVFHGRYGSGYYGLSGNVFKFSKYAIKKSPEDTLKTAAGNDSVKEIKTVIYNSATVTINLAAHISYARASLMYGHTASGCKMNVYNAGSGEKIISDTLPSAENFALYPLALKSLPRNIKLEFSGNVSPDFYGLLIDGNSGVQVDNYSIRGHSGDGLLLINPSYLAQQLKMLRTKLVILQYGANVVPSARSEKVCKSLEEMYYSIFMRYKSAVPGISVLVIGAGDMSTKFDGEYQSYPMLPKVVEAQENAARRAGCAFWNLYEVMGGLNSINTWVRKGLASQDGHFTHKGQELIGKELFNTIMTEYNHYLYRQRRSANT